MNQKQEVSAGILVYRFDKEHKLQVLLGKCGGPKWSKRTVGAWNIPKGHVQQGENLLDSAIREFIEETSLDIEIGDIVNKIYLGTSKTNFGKVVHIYAIEHDYAESLETFKVPITSNMVETEWPKDSGNMIEVPELSEAYYFKVDVAKRMIFPYQKCFIERLEEELNKNE